LDLSSQRITQINQCAMGALDNGVEWVLK